MNSFLITFKPDTENPERGWPLTELQKLVQRCRAGEPTVEAWRFHNRKAVALGDRVFLLLQGKEGPAIIGYGKVIGTPQNDEGTWFVPVQFESIVDPTTEVFANREDLLTIGQGQNAWRTQSSGVRLQEPVATQLESMVVGARPKPKNGESSPNPDWTRDELIIALDFYLQHRPNPPGKSSKAIHELSETLRRLGERLFPAAPPRVPPV